MNSSKPKPSIITGNQAQDAPITIDSRKTDAIEVLKLLKEARNQTNNMPKALVEFTDNIRNNYPKLSKHPDLERLLGILDTITKTRNGVFLGMNRNKLNEIDIIIEKIKNFSEETDPHIHAVHEEEASPESTIPILEHYICGANYQIPSQDSNRAIAKIREIKEAIEGESNLTDIEIFQTDKLKLAIKEKYPDNSDIEDLCKEISKYVLKKVRTSITQEEFKQMIANKRFTNKILKAISSKDTSALNMDGINIKHNDLEKFFRNFLLIEEDQETPKKIFDLYDMDMPHYFFANQLKEQLRATYPIKPEPQGDDGEREEKTTLRMESNRKSHPMFPPKSGSEVKGKKGSSRTTIVPQPPKFILDNIEEKTISFPIGGRANVKPPKSRLSGLDFKPTPTTQFPRPNKESSATTGETKKISFPIGGRVNVEPPKGGLGSNLNSPKPVTEFARPAPTTSERQKQPRYTYYPEGGWSDSHPNTFHAEGHLEESSIVTDNVNPVLADRRETGVFERISSMPGAIKKRLSRFFGKRRNVA